MAKKKGKKKGKAKAKAKRSAPSTKALSPTVVNLRFQNEGSHMATKPNEPGHKGKKGKKKGKSRKRNPTFVQALGRVAGAAAAMFGTGVAVTFAVSKLPSSPVTLYGVPLATALVGAGIATKMPLVGAGVAAGAAAPFVLPVAGAMLEPAPSATTKGLARSISAVSMGRGYGRRGMNAVQMGAVHTY